MLATRTDVLVRAAHEPLSPEDEARLDDGAGLVVVGGGPWDTVLAARVRRAGIDPRPCEPEPSGLAGDRSGAAAVTAEDLLARVGDPRGTVGAVLELGPGAAPLLRSARGVVVGAVAEQARPGLRLGGTGPEGTPIVRVAVVAADLPDEPWARELLHNLTTWVAPQPSGVAPAAERAAGAVTHPAWQRIKASVAALQPLQAKDGSVPEAADVPREPRRLGDAYLTAVQADLHRWADGGMGAPDFLDSLVAFQPQQQRVDGIQHLVVFPMYTQNGSPDRHLEAVLLEVRWPDFVAELEAGDYSNALFLPIRFLDFTAGYDTNSAVLFPETVAMREIPAFTWGGIFADREAARFRRVVRAAAETTGLALPPDAARLLTDQALCEETFVMWDLIHDRTHMRGDLPFDPFMIKQRMPYFLYALEELRCDLTAFREAVALESQGLPHARLVQYAVLFDRIFRFPITGSRTRNYDGLGGQLLFAWLHQHHVLHWTDNRLSIDWEGVPEVVLQLGRAIEDLYWRSIDRPKIAHWLAAYELVSSTVTPHPASTWARGMDALPLTGPLKEMTDAVLPDEFPLSMFYEALQRRIGDVVASTAGVTGTDA